MTAVQISPASRERGVWRKTRTPLRWAERRAARFLMRQIRNSNHRKPALRATHASAVLPASLARSRVSRHSVQLVAGAAATRSCSGVGGESQGCAQHSSTVLLSCATAPPTVHTGPDQPGSTPGGAIPGRPGPGPNASCTCTMHGCCGKPGAGCTGGVTFRKTSARWAQMAFHCSGVGCWPPFSSRKPLSQKQKSRSDMTGSLRGCGANSVGPREVAQSSET